MEPRTGEDLGSQGETRQRLLDAAGEVFAEKGFRSATTREICKKARANVAAINYHFGDKERLYEVVVRYAHQYAAERFPLEGDSEPADASPSQRLRTFIGQILFRTLSEGRPAWQAKLLAREMIEPTRALDSLVHTDFRPILEALDSVCREFLGPHATDRELRLATRSVIGQCVYYRHAKEVIARLHPDECYQPEDIHRLADHVTEFSLGGLERLARARVAGVDAFPTAESVR